MSLLHEVLASRKGLEDALHALLDRADRLTAQRGRALRDFTKLPRILGTARFSPGLPLDLVVPATPGSQPAPADLRLAPDVPYAAAAGDLVLQHVGVIPPGHELQLRLDLRTAPRFVANVQRINMPAVLPAGDDLPAPVHAPSPVGQPGVVVQTWFEAIVDAEIPKNDGSFETAARAAHAYALRARAGNTRRAYRSGVKAWCAWASGHGLPCLPARSADVAAFLADERGRGHAPATIELRRASLTYLHQLAGCPVPTADAAVGETMAGIRRTAAEDGFRPRRKAAATDDVLVRMLKPIDRFSLAGARDALLLLLGFWGAFRRSELACLQIEDVIVDERGLSITLPVSKGDRRAAGVVVSVPRGTLGFCAVEAYGRWLVVSGLRKGPLFRRVRAAARTVDWNATVGAPSAVVAPVLATTDPLSDRSVARIIQARATAAGLDGASFGGHSLKRGVLTTGKRKKASLPALKALARHATYNSIDPYFEGGDPFAEHPLAGGRPRDQGCFSPANLASQRLAKLD
ncbi:integrase [Endobacter medicaginis]|uniref:Integrase n=1 Tax=Endobacter medicaginis TaxID=1181271 RepID=A0A839UYE8_9PROT|nr:site-specific integrase [Endobacter medicaginis]MBB3175378.1 integrase [Endobacter medicaginis]MCX5476896.1 site-specific integrase [Endobacter medicaginis]NVN29409.1 site-specific integrase [Endobacter medicaginis]